MKIICAWCKKTLNEDFETSQVSHVMCEECYAAQEKEDAKKNLCPDGCGLEKPEISGFEPEVKHTPMPKLAAGWDHKTGEIIVIDENDTEDDRYLFKALSSDEDKIDAIVRAVNRIEQYERLLREASELLADGSLLKNEIKEALR